MGSICTPQKPIIENEVTSQIQPIQEQQIIEQKVEKVEEQKQDSITDDQKQPDIPLSSARNEQNQELKRKENKKLAKIAALADHEIIYENVQKLEKVKSPLDFQLLLNAFTNSFIFAQLQPEDNEGH